MCCPQYGLWKDLTKGSMQEDIVVKCILDVCSIAQIEPLVKQISTCCCGDECWDESFYQSSLSQPQLQYSVICSNHMV